MGRISIAIRDWAALGAWLAGSLAASLPEPVLAEGPAPAQRYNERSPSTPRSPLERRIEALVAEQAKAERRTAPTPDARLSRAATEIARAPEVPHGPTNDLVEAALRLHGIVEPPPHLIVAGASVGADEALLEELRGQLPRALGQGRYARLGVAVVEQRGALRVVVALQESFLELEPVPRALPSGGPMPLRGRLTAGFERPNGFVTSPDGRTQTLGLRGDARRFEGTFHCGPARGAYQIEITGEDRFGSTVLANFPVYCGQAAPSVLEVATTAPEAPVHDASSAEAAVFALVNADRARAGLPPLVADRRLADVARAHSRDMLEHGFVGHVSPSTGSAADRVSRAKIAAALVLENVARAYTPGEVERGLMASPGHRRNILSSEAQRVGIGAVLSQALGGARELLVTQLFIAPEAPFRPATALELRQRLEGERRKRGLPVSPIDPELDRIADGIARDLASGRLTSTTAREPLDRAIAHLGARYRSARSVFAVATEIAQVVESVKATISESGGASFGVGLAAGNASGRPGDEGHLAHHAVLLIAVPR